jgi:hypothetical protein
LASSFSPSGKGSFIIPPLEKGGEGGLQKANKDRRDIELLSIIYKISPPPSLLKRETKLVPDIFIIPLLKRGAYFPRFFHHTIRYRAVPVIINIHVDSSAPF